MLYQFFAGNSENVCGRFLEAQIGRTIALPPQPHSRLYRVAIAFGLTVMFIQPAETQAHPRPPIAYSNVIDSSFEKKDDTLTSGGVIRGTVTDRRGDSIINASIRITRDDILISGTVTDFDGHYCSVPLEPGIYDIAISYRGLKTFIKSGVVVAAGDTLTLNAKLSWIKGWNHRKNRSVLVHYYGRATILTGVDTNAKPIDKTHIK